MLDSKAMLRCAARQGYVELHRAARTRGAKESASTQREATAARALQHARRGFVAASIFATAPQQDPFDARGLWQRACRLRRKLARRHSERYPTRTMPAAGDIEHSHGATARAIRRGMSAKGSTRRNPPDPISGWAAQSSPGN